MSEIRSAMVAASLKLQEALVAFPRRRMADGDGEERGRGPKGVGHPVFWWLWLCPRQVQHVRRGSRVGFLAGIFSTQPTWVAFSNEGNES